MAAKHQLSRTWEQPVLIDGVSVAVRFRRMTVEQFIDWERKFLAYREPFGESTDDAIVERGAEILTWFKDTLTSFVTLPENELDIDGVAITTGEQIFKEFGTDVVLMMSLMSHIWMFHRFEGSVRKNLLSRFDSPITSGAPAPEAVGRKQERTAESVDSAGCVKTEDAIPAADPMVAPSGVTT